MAKRLKESANWGEMVSKAMSLPADELSRHASVSTQNRHRCRECFTCACEYVRNDRALAKALGPAK